MIADNQSASNPSSKPSRPLSKSQINTPLTLLSKNRTLKSLQTNKNLLNGLDFHKNNAKPNKLSLASCEVMEGIHCKKPSGIKFYKINQ